MSITSRLPHGSGWLRLWNTGPIDPSACGIPGNYLGLKEVWSKHHSSGPDTNNVYSICNMICWVILFACLVCLQLNTDLQRQTCLTSNPWRQHGDTSQLNIHASRLRWCSLLLGAKTCPWKSLSTPKILQVYQHLKILIGYLATGSQWNQKLRGGSMESKIKRVFKFFLHITLDPEMSGLWWTRGTGQKSMLIWNARGLAQAVSLPTPVF